MKRTVAIMQPYLWPYAGYFRLLAAADVFVVYDCVQFVRRGRIHRNEFLANGVMQWLTVPLHKPGFTDRIDAVRVADGAATEFACRLRRFPRLAAGLQRLNDGHFGELRGGMLLVDFLTAQLQSTARLLGLDCAIVRSSEFALAPELRGAERIIALCEALAAERYINVGGGRVLYPAAQFSARGITLEFLAPYRGPFVSVPERLVDEAQDPARIARAIRAEIDANLVFE